MDRGGRLVGSLNPRLKPAESIEPASARFAKILRIAERRLPRSVEIALLLLLFAATGIYGVMRGGEIASIGAALQNVGDIAARAVGFGIDDVQVVGAKQVSRADALAAAGITPSTSLLLLDAEATRERLQQNPWIAEASVRKFYPGRLLIAIKERDGFAIWQRDGKLEVISRDGTVIGADARAHLRDFPLVVGAGADKRAAGFLALVERFPAIRAEVAAAVLVAERRWNLRLKNGIDLKLPEQDADVALARLIALDRESKILSRDLTAVDLRVDGRVGVRLSDDAAKERAAAQKLRAQKKKAADS
jgi:cell division protein FtsQ